MAFIEVKPRKLSAAERKLLLLALKLQSHDSKFREFVDLFERATARYVILKRQQAEKATGSQARNACKEIAKSTRKLQGAWNKAPIEAHEILNLAYQVQQYNGSDPSKNSERKLTRSFTSAYTTETGPFFARLVESLDILAKTAELAGTPSEKQRKGGTPLHAPMIFMARDIAGGFVKILDTEPKTTPTGAFSEVLHLAVQLVDDGSEPTDVSEYVKRAVNEIPRRNS